MNVWQEDEKRLVVIRGAGDLATGIAHRLCRCGFAVVMTELAQPTVIRRTVSFAQAMFDGVQTVEGLTAVKSELVQVEQVLRQGQIPLLEDRQGASIRVLQPGAVVDAILAKYNTGIRMSDAPVVIGVGPGFVAGFDVHAVVETNRGHELGRVILDGSALPNTGIPGDVAGYSHERILRAPADGIFRASVQIGDAVLAEATVGEVDGVPVRAQISGLVRGLLQTGLSVTKQMKIGDVDHRCVREHCFTISDKARAVGGGVLEALLFLMNKNREHGMLCDEKGDANEK